MRSLVVRGARRLMVRRRGSMGWLEERRAKEGGGYYILSTAVSFHIVGSNMTGAVSEG